MVVLGPLPAAGCGIRMLSYALLGWFVHKPRFPEFECEYRLQPATPLHGFAKDTAVYCHFAIMSYEIGPSAPGKRTSLVRGRCTQKPLVSKQGSPAKSARV